MLMRCKIPFRLQSFQCYNFLILRGCRCDLFSFFSVMHHILGICFGFLKQCVVEKWCVCVCVRACVCVCVCVCVGMFMWFMRTQICIMTWVWHRYYKEKVIYEDIFSVPNNSKTLINHREWVFLRESSNAPSPVRAKFRCRVAVGQ